MNEMSEKDNDIRGEEAENQRGGNPKEPEIADDIETNETDNTQLLQKLSQMQIENACLKAAVAPENIADVAHLAQRYMKKEGDISVCVAKVLAKHPYLKGAGGVSPPARPAAAMYEKNPFAKDTLNLTEQCRLFRTNPAKARDLARRAGVKL